MAGGIDSRCASPSPPPSPRPGRPGGRPGGGRRRALPFQPRGNRSLAEVAQAAGADALLVLGAHASLWMDGAEERWHPGMGALRAKRLAIGERVTGDSFLEAARLRPGDAVLDCTLGLGPTRWWPPRRWDPAGRVVGLESPPALAAWAGEGFARLPGEAASRVEVVCRRPRRLARGRARTAASTWWSSTPCSATPAPPPPGFDLLRRLADARPLSPRRPRPGPPGGPARRAGEGRRRRAGTWPGSGSRPLDGRRGAERLYAWLDAEQPGGHASPAMPSVTPAAARRPPRSARTPRAPAPPAPRAAPRPCGP